MLRADLPHNLMSGYHKHQYIFKQIHRDLFCLYDTLQVINKKGLSMRKIQFAGVPEGARMPHPLWVLSTL